MIKWIVTTVDTSDTADGKARILKTCSTKEEAIDYIKSDMKDYISDAGDMKLCIDYNNFSVSTSDGNYGCEWNFEEIEIGDVLDCNDIRKLACKYFECHSNGNKSSKYSSDYTAQNFIDDIISSYVKTW